MRDELLEDKSPARYLRIAIPALVVAGIAAGVWYLLHDQSAIRREAPPLPTLTAVLPPPPPPPPPKPKETPPEPEKKVEEVQKAAPTPKQVDAPKPLTMNGPAQAGSDQYGIGQGEGGGDVAGGTGLGTESYGRYLTSIVQNAVLQDERVNRLAFSAQIVAWVDENRRLHIKIAQSSGDPKVDGALVSLAENISDIEEAPPGTGQFHLAVRGRRPG